MVMEIANLVLFGHGQTSCQKSMQGIALPDFLSEINARHCKQSECLNQFKRMVTTDKNCSATKIVCDSLTKDKQQKYEKC
jgi:hypothetical protein